MFEPQDSEPVVTITAIMLGSQQSVPLLKVIMHEALTCIFHVFPQ